MKIMASVPIEIGPKDLEYIFLELLERKASPYYLAKANGRLGHDEGIEVLAVESTPHPHNGDTDREAEYLPSAFPELEVEYYALKLMAAIKKRKG